MGKLTATGLIKIYSGRRVVNRINLEINPGEVVGLLGPNGAGKTTTFYMMVGLIKPDGGTIFLDGEDYQCPMYIRARKGLEYLPQEPSIFRKLTVGKYRPSGEFQRPGGGEERLRMLLGELGLTGLGENSAYSFRRRGRRRWNHEARCVTGIYPPG